MNCDAALLLLNARLDEELSSADAAALAEHLAVCAGCRAEAEALDRQDAQLRRLFAPQGAAAAALAQRVCAALPAPAIAPTIEPASRSATAPRLRTLGWMSAAAAAGFLLATAIFYPRQQTQVVLPAADPPIARLALASGPVEARGGGDLAWFPCPADAPIESASAVRTPAETSCEFSTAWGSPVRLDGDSELSFDRPHQVTLARGRSWFSAGEQPLEVRAGDHTVRAQQATFDLVCEPDATTLTVVDGEARLSGGGEERTVAAGEQVKVVGGSIGESARVRDPLLETAWITDLLVLKGQEDPELSARLENFLAQLGQAKMATLYEDEIRRLGDHAVPPLLAYLRSEGSHTEEDRRAAAAAIVADVAQPRWTPELIDLLEDANPRVRQSAAAGLTRITGRDQGLPPAEWAADWAQCQPTYERWRQWWGENKDRYPPPPRPVEKARQSPAVRKA